MNRNSGRAQAISTDLAVPGHVTTFRILEELNRNPPQVPAEVIQRVDEQEVAAPGAALIPALA